MKQVFAKRLTHYLLDLCRISQYHTQMSTVSISLASTFIDGIYLKIAIVKLWASLEISMIKLAYSKISRQLNFFGRLPWTDGFGS